MEIPTSTKTDKDRAEVHAPSTRKDMKPFLASQKAAVMELLWCYGVANDNGLDMDRPEANQKSINRLLGLREQDGEEEYTELVRRGLRKMVDDLNLTPEDKKCYKYELGM